MSGIAQCLELKGENPFKVRAYTAAARALEVYAGSLADAVEQKTLGGIEGIGKAIEAKITELCETGRLEYYENLRSEFPPGIFDLFELQGLGAKKIKLLYEKLGVNSITSLELACKDGTVAGLDGFGPKSAENFLKAIESEAQHAGQFRLGDVWAVAEEILSVLRDESAVLEASTAGSLRRHKEVVHDLDFLASTREPEAVGKVFAGMPLVADVIAHGATKVSVRLESGLQCDLRLVKPEEFAFALAYFTGSKEHNVAMRGRALKRGWTLNEYRMGKLEDSEKETEEVPEIHSEADIHKALGLDFIAPELREGKGEIEAAETGELPKLVEWTQLRGAFHNHTNASDGRHTLEQMADAAMGLGLDYLGIADHSKSSIQANGLDEERLLSQVEDIRTLNRTFDGFRLFAGVECDILKDGLLDFKDEVLAQLDYVVVSVHASMTLNEKAMTDRLIRAMQNPYATILGHMTGRLLLSRPAYQVNIPAVLDAAAETGTIVELNASPWRMDLDWRWWKLAKEKGVLCAINPDAHRADGLQDLLFGVGAARKGWLEKKDVVNCLRVDEVAELLRQKRSRMG